MRCAEAKGERARARCVRFLKDEGARNLYLFEGLAAANPRHASLLFARGRRPLAVAHTRSGTHLHLFLSDGCGPAEAAEIGRVLRGRFPALESCFGDRPGVERFIERCGVSVRRTRRYVFMELERARRLEPDFRAPRAFHRAVAGEPSAAEALADLQMRYEAEELGAERLDGGRTLAVMRARIARGEVTLVFEGGRLVACAGVNARFERTCQIGSVYVLPEYRRRGYGLSVVSAHLDRMFDRYERVVLFVDEGNAAARRLYDTLGFREAGHLLFAGLDAASGADCVQSG